MVMRKVDVRGVDGSRKQLAFVRRSGETVYVCPIGRFAEVEGGNETFVVGFPIKDVMPHNGECLPS
jgi:hypothetical protein